MSKRALRRHHRQRMINKALNSRLLSDFDPEYKVKCAVKWHDYLKINQCTCCCNPRRIAWYGKERKTIQERNNELSFKEQVEEYKKFGIEE